MMADELPSDLLDPGAGDEDTSAEQTRFVCSSCGQEFVVGQKIKFCSHCGERVRELRRTVQVDTSTKTRVLLVDDSTAARRMIGTILQTLHCEVIEAADGIEALAEIPKLQPELIVLDIHMPTVDGLQVLEALRKTTAFATTPIVMMTGDAAAAVVSRAIALKATDYIRKDDPVDTIAARLQVHLDKLRG